MTQLVILALVTLGVMFRPLRREKSLQGSLCFKEVLTGPCKGKKATASGGCRGCLLGNT